MTDCPFKQKWLNIQILVFYNQYCFSNLPPYLYLMFLYMCLVKYAIHCKYKKDKCLKNVWKNMNVNT